MKLYYLYLDVTPGEGTRPEFSESRLWFSSLGAAKRTLRALTILNDAGIPIIRRAEVWEYLVANSKGKRLVMRLLRGEGLPAHSTPRVVHHWDALEDEPEVGCPRCLAPCSSECACHPDA